jgi:hypothetical protein
MIFLTLLSSWGFSIKLSGELFPEQLEEQDSQLWVQPIENTSFDLIYLD